MEIKRREILAQLEVQGLLEKNKSRPLPVVLQRLAIISSDKAAGMQDFINHLQENAYDFAFRCELFTAAMQGKNVEREVIKACRDILKEKTPYDAIILIRGGGSKLDLSPFDSLNLCTELANMPYPVITGIGHDIDQSIADLVAHTSLKTPTAVANFLIDHNLAFESSLFERLRSFEAFARTIIQVKTRQIQSVKHTIRNLAIQSILSQHFRLKQHHQSLRDYPRQLIMHHQKDLNNLEQIIQLMDPIALLHRGYSITTKNGTLVKDQAAIQPGDLLETRLAKGSIQSIAQ